MDLSVSEGLESSLEAVEPGERQLSGALFGAFRDAGASAGGLGRMVRRQGAPSQLVPALRRLAAEGPRLPLEALEYLQVPGDSRETAQELGI